MIKQALITLLPMVADNATVWVTSKKLGVGDGKPGTIQKIYTLEDWGNG